MMPKHECYHCHQLLDETEKKTHDCWTTSEEALTQNLSDDLMDTWLRLREAAVELGEQRIYASHKSIMFARKHCYFFVRPQKAYLEVCIFLQKSLKHPLVKKSSPTSKTKVANLFRLTHRDEVEPPVTDWIREAYEYAAPPEKKTSRPKPASKPRKPNKRSVKKKKTRK